MVLEVYGHIGIKAVEKLKKATSVKIELQKVIGHTGIKMAENDWEKKSIMIQENHLVILYS